MKNKEDKMKEEKENDIKKEILEGLTYANEVAFIRRYNSIKFRTTRGGKSRWIRSVFSAKGIEFKQLDLMGMLDNGLLFTIDAKTSTGKPSDGQLKEIELINKNGGIAFLAESYEEALLLLKHYRKNRSD